MKDLISKINEAVDELKNDPNRKSGHINFVSLRELGRYCNNLLFQSEDSSTIVICFFIQKYVEELFTTFNVDAVYTEELHKARVEIYDNFLLTLPKLQECLEKNEKVNMIDIIAQVLKIYRDKVNYLNQLTN